MPAMALRTADDYLDSIRKRSLRVFYRGERMASVVDHPVAWPAANCLAETYRAALAPDTAPQLTVASPLVVARVQREDLAVSGAMTDVRGDRSRRPATQADPDLFLRVVERARGGVVLRGAKAHQTSAVHCHEHVVLPMTCAADEGAWAIACA